MTADLKGVAQENAEKKQSRKKITRINFLYYCVFIHKSPVCAEKTSFRTVTEDKSWRVYGSLLVYFPDRPQQKILRFLKHYMLTTILSGKD